MARDEDGDGQARAGGAGGPSVELPAAPDDWARLFRVLVDEAADLFTVVDHEARFRYVNRASADILGVEPDECVGRSAFEFVHQDDRQRTEKAFADWASEARGDALRFENRQVHRDGRVRDMAWTIYPLRGTDEASAGFASIARDVTALREGQRVLAQSETLHRALLENMLDPVVTIDDHGTIQTVSRSAETVFGWDPDELVGQNIKVLMPDPYHSEHDGYLANYRRTGETHVLGKTREFPVVRKGGEVIDVDLSINRVDVPGKERPMFIGSFRDVTERKRAQRAETSMLRALAALGESSAVLAHEIKNPITAVNMALRAVADKLGEDEHEIVEELASRMRRLEQQLRQSLSFAKAIRLHPSRCDAAEMFRDVMRSLDPIVRKSGVIIEARVEPDTPSFRADAMRLEEVLSNLLVNAVEMLGNRGNVRLSARAIDEATICLDVEDDGPGVPESVRRTLFDPFVTTKEEGTGLGLPICRRIVEEHGGTIVVVDAAELGGACFRLVLPVAGPPDLPRIEERRDP